MASAVTRDALIAELQGIAQRLGTTRVSRSTWKREGGSGEYIIYSHFDSWNDLVAAAGLEVDDRSRIDDDDLLAALRDAFEGVGHPTTRQGAKKLCRYSIDTYSKRWGKWENILRALRIWLEEHAPESPLVAQLPPLQTTADDAPVVVTNGTPKHTAWASNDQRSQYGPFLNFRGLQHAPINEQGVVLLFGIVAFDLGYVVEGVGTGFPDCEAKRSVSRSGDLWERVRIEFEYRSRNFRDHGHDPAGADLVVCWEHNWPDCPIEVLELKSALEELGE